MGNRISMRKKRSSRRPVEERLTRPQRIALQPSEVDYKKLRKLILSEKLAPCFDGAEDSNPDLEECPICCLFFPSLNRSGCCMKGICTECFLQMKPSNPTRPAQCPFCKYSIYAVQYHGARTQEQKRLELAEEQKVIEAKIRMQFEESQEVNRATHAEQIPSGAEVHSPLPYVWQRPNHGGNGQDVRDSQLSFTPERIEASRHEDFDVDLEEIMMAEAIWQSMQDPSLSQSSGPSSTGGLDSVSHGSNGRRSSLALTNQGEISSTESVTGGLAIAIARLAEQNIQWSDRFQSVTDNATTHQTIDESFVDEDDSSTQRAVCPNDVGSEIGCLENSLTTDDDSWESLAASPSEEIQMSDTAFVSDEDLEEGTANVNSCSASSIHSVSDRYFGSPDGSDDGVDASCSYLPPSTAVQRPRVQISDIRS